MSLKRHISFFLFALISLFKTKADDNTCENADSFTSISSGFFNTNDYVYPIKIPEQKFFNNIEFPLVLEANHQAPGCSGTCTVDNLNDWISNSAPIIDNLLLRHGAILFRGFPLNSADDFNSFVTASGYDEFPYVGGAAVRRVLAPRVFTTNESPPDFPIPYHHELAQSPKFPYHLFFHCETPAEQGGETPILWSFELHERLKEKIPHFVEKLDQGVHYIRVMPEEDDPSSAIGRGWKSTYLTEEKSIAEMKMRGLNYTWEWKEDGLLVTQSPVLKALRKDIGPGRSGRTAFFNSVIAAYTGWTDSRNDGKLAIKFADGSYLDPTDVKITLELMDELEVAFKWEKGDVILIDNRQVMHSRKPFVGKRVITASMATHESR